MKQLGVPVQTRTPEKKGMKEPKGEMRMDGQSHLWLKGKKSKSRCEKQGKRDGQAGAVKRVS